MQGMLVLVPESVLLTVASSYFQSDPDLPGPDLPKTPIYREGQLPPILEINGISPPDIPGTPIYRAKFFPPSIPVNRGPTVPAVLRPLSAKTLCFSLIHEPTDTSKQPIRTRYLGHVTGYQPIRDQYSPRTIA
eukprot:sb/3474891/